MQSRVHADHHHCSGYKAQPLYAACHERCEYRTKRRIGGGHLCGKHVYHKYQRHKQMAPFPHNDAYLGYVLVFHALKTYLAGLMVHAYQYTREIQHRRYYGGFHHLGICKASAFRHQKRRSAHYGGHYLPAGRSRRFHCASKFGLITQLFHCRYSERACRYRIGHGRS